MEPSERPVRWSGVAQETARDQDGAQVGAQDGVGASTPSYSAGLRRDMDVLRELASEESLRRSGLGVVRIAERLGREKSQVSRALRALEAEGLVERDPRNRTYQVGWGRYTRAARGVETRLVRAASTHLHRLAERHRGTVRLSVLIGGQVLPLITVTPGSTARAEAPADASAEPLLSTPSGPALVLDWSDAALAALVAAGDADAEQVLAEHLAHARRQGYVRFDEPLRLAAPVRDFRGIVLGAVELARAPDAENLPGTAEAAGRAVAETAAELSGDLGYERR
jgi:DNA-binding IclR family transcriptional regulator